MRLRWPVTTPTLDITIPNSQLGDTETYQSNAIVRENRGLAPITFKDNSWPTNIIKKFSIKCLNTTEHTNIINFLTTTASDEILLTHLSRDWIGVVTTTIPEIVTVRTCDYDIEFEFMGRRV